MAMTTWNTHHNALSGHHHLHHPPPKTGHSSWHEQAGNGWCTPIPQQASTRRSHISAWWEERRNEEVSISSLCRYSCCEEVPPGCAVLFLFDAARRYPLHCCAVLPFLMQWGEVHLSPLCFCFNIARGTPLVIVIFVIYTRFKCMYIIT